MTKHSDISTSNNTKENIVFFDGVCGLCNRFVNFLMAIDKNNRLQYAPIQGETAKTNLDPIIINDLKSMAFFDGSKLHLKSEGALKSLAAIGGIWQVVLILRIIPRFIRDGIYSFIATNRYKWWGQLETCRMPTAAERGRILP
jgi:predicted DCC family thiol-disulfide oxidoreductase YuxK